jgi:hypothetical protein
MISPTVPTATDYEVDVTCSTHADLQRGVLERPRVPGGDTWQRIRIAADEVSSDREAVQLAAQMACCTGGMCTSAVLVSWPEAG